MSLIQYTSNEMFSATDLVRKNKLIFDKIQSKEIEKAIILRDGKPAMILIDFIEYEKIMKDYIGLKSKSENKEIIETNSFKEEKDITKTIETDINLNEMIEDTKSAILSSISDDKISEEDYLKAMEAIKSLSLNSDLSKPSSHSNTDAKDSCIEIKTIEENFEEEKSPQKLKDFWDK
ncbi:hypothetical protein AAX26_00104 [Aliarcobacter thereius]|uniref:Antitoxin n=1 Tax=Aliarcobacter thereius TaxID=544718 RepID=A0A5R9H9D1_9BACT|nr:hypothetical protein [Aliarcobacter thereius]OCL88424.1 hypothetical protein AAX26_00104 [Aliarcobacter thereius]TLS72637.1 hypothetical protein FE246_04430 [Aliarcobacter thereius]TLT07726.1 hypothetical protein FE243_03020 [Aliarcobacter thereius]